MDESNHFILYNAEESYNVRKINNRLFNNLLNNIIHSKFLIITTKDKMEKKFGI